MESITFERVPFSPERLKDFNHPACGVKLGYGETITATNTATGKTHKIIVVDYNKAEFDRDWHNYDTICRLALGIPKGLKQRSKE